jgi:hypothetical protein
MMFQRLFYTLVLSAFLVSTAMTGGWVFADGGTELRF